ncbi:MAG: class I SAM-dependent methyltransferase [Clostridia bacterium]|nr:class I SAM-dependent methyltransferase [Clostridia bacterium]
MKDTLLFYNAYQDFYQMAEHSDAFGSFCREAFGADFSQDGFSDLQQIKRILPLIPRGDDVHILDMGCGNGKMLGYLQQQTGAFIHGFDYSETAIATARRLHPERSDFQVGLMGVQEYPAASFDVIIAMDTLYFAPDLTKLIAQIKRWLKPGGVFFAGYQEGDVAEKTACWETSLPAKALRQNHMACSVEDITRETYQLLRRKRQAAMDCKAAFDQEGISGWYDLLLMQTDCAVEPWEAFAAKQSRWLIAVRMPEADAGAADGD